MTRRIGVLLLAAALTMAASAAALAATVDYTVLGSARADPASPVYSRVDLQIAYGTEVALADQYARAVLDVSSVQVAGNYTYWRHLLIWPPGFTRPKLELELTSPVYLNPGDNHWVVMDIVPPIHVLLPDDTVQFNGWVALGAKATVGADFVLDNWPLPRSDIVPGT
ncbi:MAG: hypothetical protein K6T75_11005 [Acetobacteraceae bacterium]|nr:hypothetical protein [Acetobacteraceae bacterium]